jgi:large subunit ribosomal protein L10
MKKEVKHGKRSANRNEAAKVAEYRKSSRSKSVVMFVYRGTTVEEVTNLRVEMRKAGIGYVVLTRHESAPPKPPHRRVRKGTAQGAQRFAFGYEDAVAPARIPGVHQGGQEVRQQGA